MGKSALNGLILFRSYFDVSKESGNTKTSKGNVSRKVFLKFK